MYKFVSTHGIGLVGDFEPRTNHHFALWIGHHAPTLRKIAESFGIDYAVVTE